MFYQTAENVYMTDETAGYRTRNMRFSFSALLLGWWMLKQRWTSSEAYQKPSISVDPGRIVTLGENATVYCRNDYRGATFHLCKEDKILQTVRKVDYMAVFEIANIKQSNQGSYRCYYCFSGSRCSHYSAEINIQLAAQVYPKPSISVDPSGILTLGGSASIHCNGENNTHTAFYLYKQGASLLQKMKPIKSSQAVFHFANVQQSHGGIYWCSYCFHSDSDKQCSNFSSNININIIDRTLGTPSISVRPKGHLVLDSDVFIVCEGPENGLSFSLHKASMLIASQMSETDRNGTSFALSMKKLEDGGNYTCQYHHRENPFVWSEPSNAVELVVTERPMTIIWVSCAAGLLLVLLLLLLAFILYRKRRKGPQISERSQVINTTLGNDANPVYDEVSYGADLDGVTYAVLNKNSLKIKRTTVPDNPTESCVYASVAIDRNVEGH